MGGRDSSSKRKPSKRKRDTTSSKKKSRRKESKKRRRIHNSVSSYSDDESSNSEHTSSSASKSDHRRRINKNKRIRRDRPMSADSDSSSSDYKRKKTRNSRALLKRTKKRARQRSTRLKGNGDSHSGRKRKIPKTKLSKKAQKHLSHSFSSSDSESCSTCRGRGSSSSSTEENKHQRSKVIYKARKKRRVRSPSCSSPDRGGEQSVSVGHSDGAFSPVINNFSNSRRLRSVITVVDQRCDEVENKWEKDPNKEEIVYDRNDYPSPKSLDSNECGTNMELENIADEEVNELGKSRTYEGHQDNDSNAVDVNNFEKGKKIDTSAPVAALGDDVLESILRQKALENLKKFKGRLQTGPTSTNLKMNNESDANRPSDAIIENVNAQEMNQNIGLSEKQDLSQLTEVKKLLDGEDVEKKETLMDAQSVEHPNNGVALLQCSKEDNVVSIKPVSSSETYAGAEATNASITEPSSSIGPMSGDNSLERENEGKDGSEFEKKTMSVMRGGEMVQVSYKVYIPKKATALARRQLRR